MTDRQSTNAAQRTYWNEQAGPTWVRQADLFDYMFSHYGAAVIERAPIRAGDNIVDIGCGSGATTFAALDRLGDLGSAIGLDISKPLIELARSRGAEKRSRAEFVEGDAATWTPSTKWNGVISRFGTMFFDDPREAFRNIRRGCISGAYLSMACWGNPDDSDMASGLMRAVAKVLTVSESTTDLSLPGPYAFSEPERVESILTEAGWLDIEFDKLESSVPIPGSDLREKALTVAGIGAIARMAKEQNVPLSLIAETIESFLEARSKDSHVALRSPAWIVTARAGHRA